MHGLVALHAIRNSPFVFENVIPPTWRQFTHLTELRSASIRDRFSGNDN